MLWLDAGDPLVRAGVLTGQWGARPATEDALPDSDDPLTVDQLSVALRAACEILTALTGGQVHPSGTAVDEFRCIPAALRLTPVFRPIKTLVRITRSRGGYVWEPDNPAEPWVSPDSFTFESMVRWSTYQDAPAADLRTFLVDRCGVLAASSETLRVEYTFGSTVTASARAAVLHLAHELWLEATGDDSCQLPTRTTSVSRDGVSWSMTDPADYLAVGRVGLPPVDRWLMTVNRSGARRAAAIWTPESPPAVNISVTEPWPAVLPL